MADRMLDHRAVYNRIITGPIESVPDEDFVFVTAEVDLPAAMRVPDDWRSYYAVELKRWTARHQLTGSAWKEERVRDSVENKVRYDLARGIVEHFPITLRADLVTRWELMMDGRF